MLQEKLDKAKHRIEGLEREMAVCLVRWEKREEQLEEEIRNLREQYKVLQFKMQVSGKEPPVSLKETRDLMERLAAMEEEMEAKDRLIDEGHRERSRLREQLEALQRDYFELKQRYEREKDEWSTLVARQIIKEREKFIGEEKGTERGGSDNLLGWFRPREDLF